MTALARAFAAMVVASLAWWWPAQQAHARGGGFTVAACSSGQGCNCRASAVTVGDWELAVGQQAPAGAERMVLELRDKIGASPGAVAAAGSGGHAVRAPVVEALVGLGFAAKQAEEATDKVLALDQEATTSSALRAALNLLGKNK